MTFDRGKMDVYRFMASSAWLSNQSKGVTVSMERLRMRGAVVSDFCHESEPRSDSLHRSGVAGHPNQSWRRTSAR
jgi:hypothetical protein